MLYVKRIISTLQGGIDYELGPKTLIIGPNGTGKSTITRSVELALTGVASDIAGRDEVAKAIELLTLATPGKGLIAQALLSDGTEAKFELQRIVKSRGAKVSTSAVDPVRPKSVGDRVLPLRALKEAVLGKPETARKFFLSHTVREITRGDVLSRLPEQLKPLYEQAVNSSGILASRPEIDKLLSALEFASKKAGDSTREANAAQKVTAQLGQGLPPPPTEADYAAAGASLASARAALEAAVTGYQQQAAASDAQRRVAELEAQLTAAVEKHAAAEAWLSTVEEAAKALPPLPSLPDWQEKVMAAVLAMDEAKADKCYACGGAGDRLHARAEMVRAELATTEELRRKHARKDEMLAGARFEVSNWASSARGARATLDALKEALPQPSAGAPALTIEQAREAVQVAETRLRDMDAAKAAWESTKRARDGSVTASSEASKWDLLTTACGEVVRDLLDGGVAAFNARVQAYLPQSDRFGLRLRDGGREVCQFGLWRGEALSTALSGAEWARVTAALAAVCGPTSEDQLAVIRPEERAFDPQTLAEVLAALGKVPQQVLLESPIAPISVPPGWRVIETRPTAAPKPVLPPLPPEIKKVTTEALLR